MIKLLSFAIQSMFGVIAVACGVPSEDVATLLLPEYPTPIVCTVAIDERQFIFEGEFFEVVDRRESPLDTG